MAQNWTDNMYELGHTLNTDMQNTENNFAVLKSLFSGAASPAGAVAGMPFFDTTNKVLKIRNQANSAWLGVMYGNSSTPIWMYVDAAPDGWVVSGSLTDLVLAIKGGSLAYDVSGGNIRGTWTQPSHTLTVTELAAHDHGGYGGYFNSVHTHTFGGATPRYGTTGIDGSYGNKLGGEASGSANVTINSGGANHRHTVASQGGGGAHTHGTTYRPSAAVGILVAPDA